MYFSVTRANCNTSPVSRPSFGRIDLMKPPNSAPKTSKGIRLSPTVSTAIPSRLIRLTASVPSTCSRIAERTDLNVTAHLPPPHLGKPPLHSHNLAAPPLRHLRSHAGQPPPPSSLI